MVMFFVSVPKDNKIENTNLFSFVEIVKISCCIL